MKKTVLEELIKYITREIIREYMNAPSDIEAQGAEGDISGTNSNDVSQLTPLQIAKQRREAEHKKTAELKSKKLELDAEKKQESLYRKRIEQSKRIKIPQLTKDVQSLQNAQI